MCVEIVPWSVVTKSGMSNNTHKAVAMETGSGLFEIVF